MRDLFVEADLHPADCGADFAGEAERLGMVTAEVHAALREALPTRRARPEPARRARRGHARPARGGGRRGARARVRYAKGLDRAFDDLHDAALDRRGLPSSACTATSTSGRSLRTVGRLEAARLRGRAGPPADERRALDTPLRDVAGMLRSLDYAARIVLLDHPDDSQRAYRASEWVEHNADAFCDGYAAAAGRHPRDDAVLLRALVIEKAVYEVIYESRMRPSWMALPMAAIERLAG